MTTEIKCQGPKPPPKSDSRTISLDKWVHKIESTPPSHVDWYSAVNPDHWGAMYNITKPDCTCAAAGHLIMAWTAASDNYQLITGDQALAAYDAVAKLHPSPADATGLTELDVLKYWCSTGIAGHKIRAFASLDTTGADKVDYLKIAIDQFCGAYIGINLPISVVNNDPWDVPPGSVGKQERHAVPIVGYSDEFLTIITWGVQKRITWDFWNAYCDEAYGIWSDDYQKVRPLDQAVVEEIETDLAEVQTTDAPKQVTPA